MWPSQFGQKLVLGTRRRWPSPKRDIGTSQGRLCLLFGCTVVLSVLVLNIVHFSSTYAVTAGFVVFANDSRTRSILWLSQWIIGVARILSRGALFLPQKVDDLFTVVAVKTHAKRAYLAYPTAQIFPNFLKNWTLALPWGCTFCLGVHVHISPVNLAPTFFLRSGGARAPIHAPLATPMQSIIS